MKKFTANSQPTSECSLTETGKIEQFRLAIEQSQGFQVDPSQWNSIVGEYRSWERAAVGTSKTNRCLQLLKIISEKFPALQPIDNASFVNLALADVRKPGEFITMKLPSGQLGRAKIVDRKLTDRLGILYTLESDEGFRFTQEFFD